MLNRSVFENGDGGNYLLRNYEIIQTESIVTLAYLLMFGGNVAEVTKKENNTGELRTDWWGNNPTDNSSKWINSRTEKTLRGAALTNQFKFEIEQAVKDDLKSLSEYGTVTVEVTYPSLNRIQITVTIAEPSVKSSNRLIIAWDATKNEIIEKQLI